MPEYGLVNVKGAIPGRAKPMISLAHPDFRDDLEREAPDGTIGVSPRKSDTIVLADDQVVAAGRQEVSPLRGRRVWVTATRPAVTR